MLKKSSFSSIFNRQSQIEEVGSSSSSDYSRLDDEVLSPTPLSTSDNILNVRPTAEIALSFG